MRRFLFENSLSLGFGALFLGTVVAQSFAGQHALNDEARLHDGQATSWLDFVLSPSFGGALLENWQSEFLQFTLFILATVWLVQKGSNESKPLGDVGVESDRKQLVGRHAPADAPAPAKATGGLWRWVYENSLLLAMGAIFFLSWGGQSVNNWRMWNEQLTEHGLRTVGWLDYVLGADFWERTLENWQSEFLAVGTMAVFTIYLRQRGSSESKPVGAAHRETGSSG